MNLKDWAKKEVELAKLAEYVDPADGKDENEKAIFEIENAYADLVYDMALEAFNVLIDQNHSGMSIGLTVNVLNRLVRGQALTPLQGTEDEWSSENNFIDQDPAKHQQNIRNSKVFREMNEDGTWSYTYNDIFVIDNADEVWIKYPPYDDPSSLDDEFPSTKKYVEARQNIRKELNSKITFPYAPTTTHFVWNFEEEVLKEVKK